ncbi:MAG: hypothetical protein ACTHJN_01825 [Ginsengibacter sp.]
MSESIGGYFGLEINSGASYHHDSIELNTGRNAFEYILRAREYKHVYIPYYCCDVLLEPFKRLGIKYDFYSIDEKLEFVNYNSINPESGFLYINYFGLKGSFIKKLFNVIPNLIIDASQAFFYKPLEKRDVFYSPRKFFGVPDGGYASCDKKLPDFLPEDISINRFSHLLKRIDTSPEEGYNDFVANENKLSDQPIKKMSKITSRLLSGIDHEAALNKRNENFVYLHKNLGDLNGFKWINEEMIEGAMVYPFYSENENLRKRLIENKIYIATYWPNVKEWIKNDTFEYRLPEQLLPLPVDQRYSSVDLKKIINIING